MQMLGIFFGEKFELCKVFPQVSIPCLLKTVFLLPKLYPNSLKL